MKENGDEDFIVGSMILSGEEIEGNDEYGIYMTKFGSIFIVHNLFDPDFIYEIHNSITKARKVLYEWIE